MEPESPVYTAFLISDRHPGHSRSRLWSQGVQLSGHNRV